MSTDASSPGGRSPPASDGSPERGAGHSAPTFVLRPDDYAAAANAFGGKAAALARLQGTRFDIPAWFVVAPEALEASLTEAQWEALRSSSQPDDIRRIMAAVKPAARVRQALASALAALCPQGEPVAVRSSARDEDSAQHSFAGQLESFLQVVPAEVEDRVVDVWRSGFSERVLQYRREAGLTPLPNAPAVLVQRMIEADLSGVAFSADPVSGRRGVAVVSAVYGLGAALVSGEAEADTYHVARDDRIVLRSIADKATAQRRAAAGREGVANVPVAAELRQLAALSDDWIRQVAGMARGTAQHFERPQDIEWAIADGNLYLLQSRPITSLADSADPDGERRIWDNSNIVESYGGVTTPLTFSFARHAYEGVYRNLCRILGFSKAKLNAHANVFRNMLGLVRGRIYYNLLSWYRILAALPGYQSNRHFMEQMMGVKEGLPDDIVNAAGASSWRSRLRDRLDFAASVLKLVVSLLTLPRSIRRFYQRLQVALAEPAIPLRDMRPDELVAHYRELERDLLLGWDAPLVNDFFAMIFYGVLRRLTERWCGDSDGTLQNDLLSGEGGMISAEPAARVRELAQLAATRPGFPSLLGEASAADITAGMGAFPEFERSFQDYLETFGDRCLEELKLESPTLADNPLPLMRAIGLLAQHPAAAEEAVAATAPRQRAEALVAEAIANPFRRQIFMRVLRQARDRVRDRENLRFERTRLFGRIRRIFLELGRRLFALDLLDRPRDIFFLELDEILGFVEGTSTTARLRELVALRRQDYQENLAADPLPDRFETRGMPFHGNRFEASGADVVAPGGDTLKGIGCCPGVVRGKVRVVSDPYQAQLDVGDILVADHTDPGWIILFPSASGLLVERGSLLSHAAIVARELGIPAVVSLPGITRWLRDGDWVEFDGSSGVVRRLDPPHADEGATEAATGAE